MLLYVLYDQLLILINENTYRMVVIVYKSHGILGGLNYF
jgi:hypothetical protein